jgi:uncharacterized membrane protein YjjP (DUF1212 family)
MNKSADIKFKIKFIMLMAKALHRYGASADRVETALMVLSENLNVQADYFALPTSIMASFRMEDDEFTRMLRLEPGKINLEKLYYSDKTVDDVIDEKITLTEGINRLQFIIDKPAIHSELLSILGVILLAFNVAIILGGNLYDASISGLLGLVAGTFTSKVKIERIDTIFEALIAFLIALSATLLTQWSSHLHSNIVILSSLIYFVPGLNLTMAIGEVASQNLTAGSARFMGAIVILLKIAFGTYLGTLVANYFTITHSLPVIPLGLEIKIIALILISLSFVINFQARWQETLWIMLAGISTFFLNSIVSNYLGHTAAALIAGTYIGAGSNFYARVLLRPSMIVSLPAIILLVPGSLGFKSLEFLFSQNTLSGINSLFNTLTIGLALVAGTYFGSLIIKPKRSL